MKDIVPPEYLSPEQIALFDRLGEKVVRMGFALPAIIFLESMRPVNFIGSQVMLFFHPVLRAWFTLQEYDMVQKALEHRETMGYLSDVIEAHDEIARLQQKEWKAKLKAEKRAKKEAKRKP